MTKVVETLSGNDAFRYLSTCANLFASSVNVNCLIPPGPPVQCCVGAVVRAVEEIEKSTLVSFFFGGGGGERGKMCPRCPKIDFIANCLNTFVAHCSCSRDFARANAFELSSTIKNFFGRLTM